MYHNNHVNFDAQGEMQHSSWTMVSLWNVTNFRVTQHPHWIASLEVPGLNFDSFYFNGAVKIHSLMNLASTSRNYVMNVPYNEAGDIFMDLPDMLGDNFVFVSSVRVTISKTIYDMTVPKHTLNAKFHQGYVGNSSTAAPIKFYVPGSEEPLFEQVNQIVTIDRETRRPTPLPDWFKDKYKGKGILNEPLIVKPKPRPEDTFVHQMQVQWSHTDMYEHANYTAYPRYAIDSVQAALWSHNKHGSSSLKGLTYDAVDNGLKQMEICYLQQSLQNDLIDVHVWQEEGHSHQVTCSMCCNGTEICQVSLEYFERE